MTIHTPCRTFAATAALVTFLSIGLPDAGMAQPQGGPQPPGGRTVSTAADCSALQKEWDNYKDQWGQQHQACLDSHQRGNVRAGPTCSKAPCQQLHYLVYEYAASEGSRMMDECRAIVSQIAKQKAEYDAAVRRYNEQVAEQNRRLLQALNQQNAEVAEQNRLAQEAVAQRNRAAQREFENLVRQYNLRVSLADQANATLHAMREALRGTTTELSNSVSNLVDELGSVTFGDALNETNEAGGMLSQTFEFLGVATDTDPPEQLMAHLDRLHRFTAAWNMLQAGLSTIGTGRTALERFDDQITGLSSSTTFLFSRTPWVGSLVSGNIDGIGRWGNAVTGIVDDLFSGRPPSDERIRESFARSFFPRFMWLNDRITQVQGSANQLYQLFGR